jgi:putative ABC transport system permease protein
MDTLRQDIRYTLATLRRAPGFTAAALLTLALGIGGTTAVFTVVHGLLWRSLPYPQADRLVRLWEEHPGGVSPAGNRWLSSHTYAAWREHSRTLDGLGGFRLYDAAVVFNDNPWRVAVSQVSPAVFGMLGAAPAIGRFFTAQDDRPGAARVVVLSDDLWRDRYASHPAILGQSIVIDGDLHTIVGVARPELRFPDPHVQLWLPYVIPQTQQQARTVVFTALGRLVTGATPAQAEAEGTAAARSAPRHPLTEFFFGKGGAVVVHARPLADDLTLAIRPALMVLIAAVGLLLLIACANVANLVLTRGIGRQRELAVRAALGGSPARIFRQLLTESAALAIAGGSLGLLLAWWLVHLVPMAAPPSLPRLEEVRIDARVIGFCALTTMFAALVCGVAPALRAASPERYDAFRDSGGTTGAPSGGRRSRRLGATLLLAEAAFATILVVGAVLLAHSFIRLINVDAGYTPDRVLTAAVELPRAADEARMLQFIDTVLPRLRALPGVASAGAANMIPLMRRSVIAPFTLPSDIAGAKPVSGRALTYTITPGYAEALGLRLREGRLFNESDGKDDRSVVIVNQEFVRQHVSARPAVGLRLPSLFSQEPGLASEIVGVVANVLKDGNDRSPQPEMYFPHRLRPRAIVGEAQLIVRTAGEPAALGRELRSIVQSLEPAAVVDRIEPLTTAVAASVDQPRFTATVLGYFAALSMILAAVGLQGVLSYTVAQRRRELGVRAALGAGRVNLIALVLRDALMVTLVGVGLGLVGAAGLARATQWLLFGIAPLDGTAFALGPVLLMAVAAVACLRPALLAASTDPARVLRGE